jgi:hypothetical protein
VTRARKTDAKSVGLTAVGPARTMYSMSVKAEERVELRAPVGRKKKWVRAATHAGISLSDWARRGLDELADEELGTDEPPAPSAEDIEESLKMLGCFKGAVGVAIRARIHAARETPWTVD